MDAPAPYRVQARNLSHASENMAHAGESFAAHAQVAANYERTRHAVLADQQLGKIVGPQIEIGLRVIDEADHFPGEPIERATRFVRRGKARRDGS